MNFSKSSVYSKLHVVNRDGFSLVEGEQVSVINCLGLTFMKQLNVSAQGKSLINHQHVDYIYYFEQQLSCNESASKSWSTIEIGIGIYRKTHYYLKNNERL